MQTRSPGTAAGFAAASGSSAVERRDEVPTKPAMWQGPGFEGAALLVQINPSGAGGEVFVGIDWGGSFHQVCLIDERGQVQLQRRIGHDVAGFDELDRLLTSQRGRVRVAIERAEGLLVEHLQTMGVEVFCVSPKISARRPGNATACRRPSPTPSTRSSWLTPCSHLATRPDHPR